MTAKTYACKCHVCGREYEHEAEFLYSPVSLLGLGGEERVGRACPTHSPDEIRAAYLLEVAA